MLKDLNYFPLDVESNVYGMTSLEFEDKTNKVLVATLDCRIYCINYNRFTPQTKEVEFTYIPTGAKIISIGALKRGPNDFVIGITHSMAPSTIIKSSSNRDIDSYSNRQTTYYLNIYASESVLPNFDLDHVAQGCQTLRLRYVPYHLYSTEWIKFVLEAGSSRPKLMKVPFWLLSGGDNNLHAFFEDEPNQSFNEWSVEDRLPELGQNQGIVLWIDIANLDRSTSSNVIFERVVALGYEDGSIRLLQSIITEATGKFELVKEARFESYSTIIPCVRLFRINSKDKSKSLLRHRLRSQAPIIDNRNHTEESLNLLVVSSTNPCLIFRDVCENGLEAMQELPDSQRLDCLTTASIGDTNADGFNELLIGTHGKELLTYQYMPLQDKYVLGHVNNSNYPIYALSVIDLTGDAFKDVIILLANGILVMQSSTVKEVLALCKRRLEVVLSILDKAS